MSHNQAASDDFILAQPESFARLTFHRVRYFWTGTPELLRIFWLSGNFATAKYLLFTSVSVLAFWGLLSIFRDRSPAAPLFLIALLALPLIYYVTHPTARYRHPIEPMMVLLGAYTTTKLLRHSFANHGRPGKTT